MQGKKNNPKNKELIKEVTDNYNKLSRNFDKFYTPVAYTSISRSCKTLDQVNKLLKKEQAGRNRKTIIRALTKRHNALNPKKPRTYGHRAKSHKIFQPVQRFANVRWSGEIEFEPHWFVELKMHKEKQDETI